MLKRFAFVLCAATALQSGVVFADGNDDCPGANIAALPFNDTGTTIGGNNTITSHASATCTNYTAVAGPDKIYRIEIGTAGSLNITVTPSGGYDAAIYLLNDATFACPAGTGTAGVPLAACVAGADDVLANAAETITVASIAPGIYSFYVDSFYSTGALSAGPFTVAATGTAVIAGGAAADLSITKTDGVTAVNAGGSTTYTITASNAGPSAVTGATVTDTFPAACTSVNWTCVGAGSGTCTASGTGNISDATVNLPVGGSVTYTATCAISAAATGSLANTATIAGPGAVMEVNPANNTATDTDTINTSSAPTFAYSPAAGSTVTFAGGGAIGSTGTASIAVSVATAGVGTGAAATTTTTCTAPTAPFTGFGQTVTAEGTGAISGSPLTGTCTLGAAAVTQTLTCSENRGGTPTAVTFNLECPAGTAAPLTSTPVSGSTVPLAPQALGGPATTAAVTFQNPGAADATVTCTAPAATEFTVAPLSFTVPAAGSASTTVSYSSGVAGSFTGTLTCTAGAQTFTFNLTGSTVAGGSATGIPALGDHTRSLMILAMLAMGLIAVGLYSRRS